MNKRTLAGRALREQRELLGGEPGEPAGTGLRGPAREWDDEGVFCILYRGLRLSGSHACIESFDWNREIVFEMSRNTPMTEGYDAERRINHSCCLSLFPSADHASFLIERSPRFPDPIWKSTKLVRLTWGIGAG